ncbi:MAG: hypothetical protein PHR39_06495 [Actinomycetota bacterium]|nr:hypothetical protein [Actinomycetota bacterium]
MACKHINKVTSFKGLPNIKKRYLLFLWELPQLLLAFLFYVILKPRIAYRLRYMDAKIYLIKNFPGGISLSYIIFLNDQNTGNNNSIKHEYGHSMQSLRLG